MIKSKAIKLLKTLNKKEFKEFGDFVRSPFFNKNPKQIQLYGLLKKYYPEFDSPQLTKENLYSRLFPGKKFKDNEIRRNLSELLRLSEDFLSHSSMNKSDEFLKKKSLLTELSMRKLDNLFDIELNELYRKNGGMKDIEDDYFMRNFELQVIKINNDQGRMPAKDTPGSVVNDLLNCFKYLAGFSLIITLKLNQDFLAIHTSYDFDYKNTLAFKFLEKLNLKEYLEDLKIADKNLHDIIKIYYTHFLVQAGFDKDDLNYWELKKMVGDNLLKFSRFEKYNLMLFLESCASIKIREGKSSFVEEIHEIHKQMLEKNLYESSDSNYMHITRFSKIIGNALSLKKFDWTENFIKEYSQKLLPESIENMRNYAFSLLYFARQEFEKALELASKVKTYDFNINFSTKVLKLKCFYELGYYEEIFYSVDSNKHTLRKDTISPDWAKQRFLNFITNFEHLSKLKIKESADETEIKHFKENLSKADAIFEKQWLKEKLDGLIIENTH